MAKILIGIVAVIACFYLAESLDCNKCSFSLFGYCFISGTETCSTNTSVCYTTQATFPDVTSFKGFSKQGCIESTSCGTTTTTTNGTNTTTTNYASQSTTNYLGVSFLNMSYTITSQCCNTDKCNPVDLSGASANSMSMTVALSVAALAAMWGSYM